MSDSAAASATANVAACGRGLDPCRCGGELDLCRCGGEGPRGCREQGADAGRFDVVSQLAQELEARRLARAGGKVLRIDGGRERRLRRPLQWMHLSVRNHALVCLWTSPRL